MDYRNVVAPGMPPPFTDAPPPPLCYSAAPLCALHVEADAPPPSSVPPAACGDSAPLLTLNCNDETAVALADDPSRLTGDRASATGQGLPHRPPPLAPFTPPVALVPTLPAARSHGASSLASFPPIPIEGLQTPLTAGGSSGSGRCGSPLSPATASSVAGSSSVRRPNSGSGRDRSDRDRDRSQSKLFVGQLPQRPDVQPWLEALFKPYGVQEVQVRRVTVLDAHGRVREKPSTAFVWVDTHEAAEAAVQNLHHHEYKNGRLWFKLSVVMAWPLKQ